MVSILILSFGSIRAFQIGRAFVNRTYRSRAYWGSLLMAAICVTTPGNLIPYPASGLGAVLSTVPFGLCLVLLLAFVDRGIAVAMDGDIFHRDIWHWSSLRFPAYVALVGAFLATEPGYYFESVPAIADSYLVQNTGYLLLAVVPVVFAYSVGALVVGGRRTSDLTMKRHIKMLGIGFLAFIISFPFFFASGGLLALFPNVLIIVANYFLYRAVMSLSSFGKLEKLDMPTSSANLTAASGTH